MDHEIRPCEEADVERIWEKGLEAVSTAEDAQEEQFVFQAVDEQGTIVGGCVLDIDKTKTAEFERLWVDARCRRRGIGSALIREAEQKARERGCLSIVNGYTFDFQTARRLFERRGYGLIGVVADWPRGHENYILTKRLDGPGEACAAGPEPAGCKIVPGGEAEGSFLTDRLEADICAFAPRSHGYLDLDRKVVDQIGRMLAGCVAGVSGWDTLHIDAFWADDSLCYEGVGSLLLRAIEREAKAKGAYLALTAGPDQQAAFFTRHGYATAATFPDPFPWHTLYKRL